MSCKKVVCDECSTKIEGINTCLQCLERKVSKVSKGSGWFVRGLNSLAGLTTTAFGVLMLVAIFFWLGKAIPAEASKLTPRCPRRRG